MTSSVGIIDPFAPKPQITAPKEEEMDKNMEPLAKIVLQRRKQSKCLPLQLDLLSQQANH